jgi:hypothetical protein
MKPIEERLMTKEAIMARLLAIGSKPKLKPPPTAQEKAQEAWKPTLEVLLKNNAAANQRALERAEREQQEAQRLRQHADFIRRAQLANETAVELGYMQRRWDALAERRWDPTGNWGPQRY